MTTTVQQATDETAVDHVNSDEQAACACPTHTTPGTYHDRITTVHIPSCQLYRAGDSTTRRYAPGTLDALLDERFGPVTA